jgi:hypothetical protein
MFKKFILLLFVSLSVAGCVDDSSSTAYSYRPPTSIVAPRNYINITKSNFSQYFTGTPATPDDGACTYAGCKLPATYSFSFTKKSNFKFESSVIIFFSGTASITVFYPVNVGGQGKVTGTVSGNMTMTGSSTSFTGKFTVNAFCSGCGSSTARITSPSWDISSISGRIYY